MTKLRTFLFGVLIGQAIMIPHIYRWMKYPVIVAFPVSNDIYNDLPPYQEHIADVITTEERRPHPMILTLMNASEVRAKYKQIYGTEEPNLLGFYLYDKGLKTHFVYCVRSPEVIMHEIRHAFEGNFHRGEK